MMKLPSGRLAIVVASASSLIGSDTYANVIRVPSQFASIASALTAATEGDTVLVAPGTYTNCDEEPCLPNVAVLRTGVSLVSEAGAVATVLRVDTGAGGLAVIYGSGIGSSGAVIDGFTVTGSASGYHGLGIITCQNISILRCVFEDLDPGVESGAAIRANGSSLRVIATTVRRCRATQAGSAIFATNGSLFLISCDFVENSQGGAVEYDGTLWNSQLVVENCLFLGNQGTNFGGLAALTGQLIRIEGSLFLENTTFSGAALVVNNFSNQPSWTATVEGNLIAGNSAVQSVGGMIWTYQGVVRNNVFVGNVGSMCSSLGDFSVGQYPRTFQNNIFAGGSGGPALYTHGVGSPPSSAYNLFWNNSGGDYENYVPSATDVFADPEFCDPDAGEFTVHTTSPCLPENSGVCGLIGVFGEGCGALSVESTSWGRIKSLFRNPGGSP